MKITIEQDDGEKQVFEKVTDAYLAFRSLTDIATKNKKLGVEVTTRSYSWGNNLRDIVKEIHQSEIELQQLLTKQNDQPRDTTKP